MSGCGYEQELFDGRQQEVTLASAEDITNGSVLPASYLVSFKTSAPVGGATFIDEYQQHYMPLADRQRGDPRVKDMYFLTSLDLRDDPDDADAGFGGSGANRGIIAMPPRYLQDEPVVGSLTRVDFLSPEDAVSALTEWHAQGLLHYAEPNYVSKTAQTTDAPADESIFGKHATDYAQLNYWWFQKINLHQTFASIAARDVTQPGVPTDEAILAAQPIIAVLDSGVDYGHPALASRIWKNQDLNTSGCTNDTYGCNTTKVERGKLGNGDVHPFDTSGPGESCFNKDSNCSHGTHVAGIIAADNAWVDPETGRPASGVCPVCRLMVLKIVSRVGNESGILDSAIIAAFKYVTLRRSGSPPVRLVNASFGKFVRSRSVGLLVRLLREKFGTLVVAAAGNEDTLTMEYPGAFKDAIAVAAVDSNLLKVAFSNFGRWVDISAPGNGIVSTVPGASLDTKSGTSMAAPMVAGVAGLMLTRYPDIGYGELRRWLLESADASFYAPGVNRAYYEIDGIDEPQPLLGYGVLNALGAINKTPAAGLPIFTALDRVEKGCGVVGVPASFSWLTLFAPLLVIVCMSLWRCSDSGGPRRSVCRQTSRRGTGRSR